MQTRLFARSGFLLGVALLAACAGDSSLGTTPTDDNLLGALQSPTQFSINDDGSLVEVVASSRRNDQAKPIQFTIVGGTVEVRAAEDGRVFMDGLSLELADVSVPADILPPDGLDVRELRVSLDHPVVAQATFSADGASASSDLPISITIDWSAEFGDEGSVYPLRSIHLEDMPLHAELALDGGAIRAQVSAARSGRFWDWAEMFDLSDLVLEIEAVAP
jgi:hypothetical protein